MADLSEQTIEGWRKAKAELERRRRTLIGSVVVGESKSFELKKNILMCNAFDLVISGATQHKARERERKAPSLASMME